MQILCLLLLNKEINSRFKLPTQNDISFLLWNLVSNATLSCKIKTTYVAQKPFKSVCVINSLLGVPMQTQFGGNSKSRMRIFIHILGAKTFTFAAKHKLLSVNVTNHHRQFDSENPFSDHLVVPLLMCFNASNDF